MPTKMYAQGAGLKIMTVLTICTHMKSPTQDGRKLRRYARRWLVERFFAWIQWRRRLLVRWEFYPQNFIGFVQLACLLILFRQF